MMSETVFFVIMSMVKHRVLGLKHPEAIPRISDSLSVLDESDRNVEVENERSTISL